MIEPPPPTNAIELQGTPKEIGKAIYWLLCGKKVEGKEDV